MPLHMRFEPGLLLRMTSPANAFASALRGSLVIGWGPAAVVTTLLSGAPLHAQTAPTTPPSNQPAQQQQQPTARRGIGQLGQTSIFDNVFNPAISLSADFAAVGSTQRETTETANRFHLRSVELGVVGRVDPLLSYQLYLHFDEHVAEVEEAFVLADNWLPDTFQLKAGRFNLDFGKLSPLHDHDLLLLDKPQVLQEYLGGSLRGTGLELHHWFPLGDYQLVRWSVGACNSLDGDAHSTFGPASGHHHEDDDGPTHLGGNEAENLAVHGRASLLLELGTRTTVQLGISGAWAPEIRFSYDNGSGTRTRSLRRGLLGADVSIKHLDPGTGQGTTFVAEVLLSRKDTFDTTTETRSTVESTGFYALLEHSLGQRWTLGASGGKFGHAETEGLDSWDAGIYSTWHVDEFNRLRLEGRRFDDPDQSYWGFTLQWTIILGSHGHGIDW